MTLFTDQVFWIDTAVRLLCDTVLMGFTLWGLYLWRGKPTSRIHNFRFALLLNGRFWNLLSSLDFYGVKYYPPTFGLFTTAIQSSGDQYAGVLFALAYFTVMLKTAKFNREVNMTVPHVARVLLYFFPTIYIFGFTACVIVAVVTHSTSPALGFQRVLTGVCNFGCFASASYILIKVIKLIDTGGTVHVRRKFIYILVICICAGLIMLIQQVQSGLAYFGPIHYQSAKDYFPANPTGPRIDSYNLFAVIDQREYIVLSEVVYDFSWYFASLLRLVYVPVLIFASYPATARTRDSSSSSLRAAASVTESVRTPKMGKTGGLFGNSNNSNNNKLMDKLAMEMAPPQLQSAPSTESEVRRSSEDPAGVAALTAVGQRSSSTTQDKQQQQQQTPRSSVRDEHVQIDISPDPDRVSTHQVSPRNDDEDRHNNNHNGGGSSSSNGGSTNNNHHHHNHHGSVPASPSKERSSGHLDLDRRSRSGSHLGVDRKKSTDQLHAAPTAGTDSARASPRIWNKIASYVPSPSSKHSSFMALPDEEAPAGGGGRERGSSRHNRSSPQFHPDNAEEQGLEDAEEITLDLHPIRKSHQKKTPTNYGRLEEGEEGKEEDEGGAQDL